jgi:pantothenate synthetase
MREQLRRAGVQIDYATIADPETLAELAEPLPEMMALVAGRVGQTRLIDNLPISL